MKFAVVLVAMVASAGCLSGVTEVLTGDSGIEFHEALVWPEPDTLIVQISHVEGREPSTTSIDRLREELQAETMKSSIVIREPDLIQAGNGASDQEWTVAQIRQVHTDHFLLPDPGSYVSGGQMYIHFIFLNGIGVRDEGNFAGLAIRPDFYVFPDAAAEIGILSQPIRIGVPNLVADDVEAAIVVHELGHGFGLVGRGAPETADRKTSAADDPCECHSTNEDSVMYQVVENFNPQRFLESQEWVRGGFDATDRADLAALRARY